jgi:ribonuclease J
MISLTIHRGTHEIGGSCVELQNGSSRIVIDIGMPLVDRDKSQFDINKYRGKSGADLVANGVLPNVAGLYQWQKDQKPPDGILLSHAHIDHYGFINYVRDDIPYYLGEASKKLIDLTIVFTPLEGEIYNANYLNSGMPFNCGDFKITPYLMDHSAFDSYAFLIEADGKKIVYSGDFREHGRKTKAFYWFLYNCPKDVDAILLEGTMFGRQDESILSEQALEQKAIEIIRANDNITMIYCSGQNIDRLVSFYKATRHLRKQFVVDVYTANILNTIAKNSRIPFPSRSFPEVRVFFPHRLTNKLVEKGHGNLVYPFKNYKIKKRQISENPGNVVMLVRPSMISDLERIKNLDGGVLIYSMWDGYLKNESTQNLLEFVAFKGFELCYLHTSGHAYIQTIKKAVNVLEPKCIIPIHTFSPEKYDILGCPVRLLNDGEKVEI